MQRIVSTFCLLLAVSIAACASEQQWEARLQASVAAALRHGKEPRYQSMVFRQEVVVINANAGQIGVRMGGGDMTLPWRMLKTAERQSLAMSCVRAGDVDSLSVALYYCLATGNHDDAISVRLLATDQAVYTAMEAAVAADPPAGSAAEVTVGTNKPASPDDDADKRSRDRERDRERTVSVPVQREADARAVYLGKAGPGGGALPQHGMVEASERRGWYDPELARRGANYLSERTVYCDTDTGRLVWRMTRNPGLDEHGYYDTLAWNADGSLMLVDASRRGGSSKPVSSWLMQADGSRVRPMPPGQPGDAKELKGYWSVQQPDVYYVATRNGVDAINPLTGARSSVARGRLGGGWMMPPHPSDDWFLFCSGWETGSKAWVLGRNGSVREVETGKTFCWLRFTGSPDQRIFFEVQKGAWEQWTILPDGSSKHRVTGGSTKGGHAGWTPDGGWMTFMGSGSGGYAKIRPDGKDQQTFLRGGFGGCHGLTCRDGVHFVSDTDSSYSGGGAILRSTLDGKMKEVVCRYQGSFYYSSASKWRPHYHSTHPHPNPSPDGTKIVFSSDMMGHFSDMYVAVAKLPDAPAGLAAQERNGSVRLQWEPGEQHRETAGYLVYRASSARGRWERVTDKLVTETEWRGADSSSLRYYVVTAVEHSGLESPASPVAVARGDDMAMNREGGGRFIPDREPPAAPSRPSARASGSTALTLQWRAPDDGDVDHYNVYAAPKSFSRCDQARLIGSPSEAEFVDQGLQLQTTYHYLITAVDRNGNESDAVAVSGETDQREPFYIALDVHGEDSSLLDGRRRVASAVSKPNGSGQARWTVDVPRSGTYVMWVLADLSPGDRVEFDVDVGGTSQRYWHYGPTDRPAWNAVGLEAEPMPVTFALRQGRVPVSLRRVAGKAAIRAVILTDDPGWDPMSGISRFGPVDTLMPAGQLSRR